MFFTLINQSVLSVIELGLPYDSGLHNAKVQNLSVHSVPAHKFAQAFLVGIICRCFRCRLVNTCCWGICQTLSELPNWVQPSQFHAACKNGQADYTCAFICLPDISIWHEGSSDYELRVHGEEIMSRPAAPAAVPLCNGCSSRAGAKRGAAPDRSAPCTGYGSRTGVRRPPAVGRQAPWRA